jgi:hypothetical protein
MTGALSLTGAPSLDAHATTKKYVDNGDAGRVVKTGDTMTGTLTVANAGLTIGGSFSGAWQGIIGHASAAGGVGVLGTGNIGTNWGELGGDGFGVRGSGSTYGVYGQNVNSTINGYIGGTAYAVYGTNGAVNGYVAGPSFSLYGAGGTYGVYADGSTMGGRFRDSDSLAYGYVGYNTWGFYTPNDSYVGGNVGIGTTAPTYKFHLVGNMYVNGIAYKSTTVWTVPSDIRLKNVTGDFKYGLDELDQITPFKFTYKPDNAFGFDSKKENIGVSAQDVEKVIPEAVSEDKGYRILNTDPIFWTMLNSIKELKAQNEELEARVEALERQ